MTPAPDHSSPLPDRRIELVEERVRLGRRVVDRGGVRVDSRTETVSEVVQATLSDQSVEVTRVPVGRFVDAVEPPRTEAGEDGETTVLPVYEERIVSETRLFLVEEVHVRRRASARSVEVPIERRRQVAHVTRLPPLEASANQLGEATMLSDTSTSSSRTLTAVFDTSAEAERAVERLHRAGVADSSIRVTAGTAGDASTYGDRQRGFWESLGDFFFPDEDRYAYAEGLARGAQLVTVSSFDSSMHDQIVDILDDEGSVDMDAREGEWRSSGDYTDYRDSSYYNEDEYARTHGRSYGEGAVAAGTAATDTMGRSVGTEGAAVDDAMGGEGSRGTIYDDGVSDREPLMSDTAMTTGTTSAGADLGAASGDYDADAARDVTGDDTVKVVEERLAVGKREAEGGRVRVRSYVREVPVEASVDLRSTRVFVDRRPVDRPASGDATFEDRTIEAREHVEEAVVGKEARVVEEIGLREETDTRTETVSDTVRKTEVEIEDERTGETTRITGDDATGTSGRGTSGGGTGGTSGTF